VIKIVELDDALIPQAEKLVNSVFREQDLEERLSFWVYKNRNKFWMKAALKLYGTMEYCKYWVAINEAGEIVGTTGLYSVKKDIHEAIWLSWFCVNPNCRGQGIGKQLIEFSIDMARSYGKKYLRLYTSDDPNEVEAQFLYEKYGFKETEREVYKAWTLIYREKVL